MGLTLKVAPSVEPVTLAEAKLHCKMDSADDDALITALIVAARQQAEHRTNRALVTQQWELTLEAFPDLIELPKPALVSVQSVKYLDDNGVLQTLASTEYQVVISELIGYIQPAFGKTWPSCRVQPDSVVVAYTCGYGAADAVPQSIKAWMLMAIGTMYNQREGIITGTIVAEVPRDFFAGLLDPYWVPGL
jgi:uncharacterized phiE125 gp8 family phage protein